MFRLFLNAYGYSVLTAENGETGLRLVREHHPGIVFTDLKMPGMDGFDVLKQIKKTAPETEVVVITGHGDMDHVVRALNLDATDFINKPIGRSALDAALKRAEARLEDDRRDKVPLQWRSRPVWVSYPSTEPCPAFTKTCSRHICIVHWIQDQRNRHQFRRFFSCQRNRHRAAHPVAVRSAGNGNAGLHRRADGKFQNHFRHGGHHAGRPVRRHSGIGNISHGQNMTIIISFCAWGQKQTCGFQPESV
jgi:YesN/AraC family two-component response regulator